jgi:hypothetical protein
MGWTHYLITSQRRVDMQALNVLLNTRGELPSPDDPEEPVGEGDAAGNLVRLVQPVQRAKIFVTLETAREWESWPARWRAAAEAKLGGRIEARVVLDYKNRADLEGIDPGPIMPELRSVSDRANFLCFVWLRIMGEFWGWPTVFCTYRDDTGDFVVLAAEET